MSVRSSSEGRSKTLTGRTIGSRLLGATQRMVVFVREVWGLARSNSAQCRWAFGWVTAAFRLFVWLTPKVLDTRRSATRDSRDAMSRVRAAAERLETIAAHGLSGEPPFFLATMTSILRHDTLQVDQLVVHVDLCLSSYSITGSRPAYKPHELGRYLQVPLTWTLTLKTPQHPQVLRSFLSCSTAPSSSLFFCRIEIR